VIALVDIRERQETAVSAAGLFHPPAADAARLRPSHSGSEAIGRGIQPPWRTDAVAGPAGAPAASTPWADSSAPKLGDAAPLSAWPAA
jgi:hypothetical protein